MSGGLTDGVHTHAEYVSQRAVPKMSAPPGRAQASHAPTFIRDELDWQKRASCAGHNPEMFFPTTTANEPRDAALAICFRCDVHLECLSWALRHQPDGIWGATTQAEREVLSGRRRRRVA